MPLSEAQRNRGYQIPEPVTGYETICVQLEIPNVDEYRQAFLGNLYRLTKYWNWERSFQVGDYRASEAAQMWLKLLNETLCIDYEGKGMGCCCKEDKPSRKRVNPENGHLQQSFDDGVTWEDVPQSSDPRYSDPVWIPDPLLPPAGDDRRCTIANNITTFCKTQTDQFIADGDAWTSIEGLVAAFIGLLVFFEVLSVGALTPIIVPLIVAVQALGLSAFSAAMTEEVYDTLRCSLYCALTADGEITETTWQTVMQDMGSQLTGVASLYLQGYFRTAGIVGMKNMAAIHDPDPVECDCPDCPPEWCYEIDFTASDGGFAGAYGTWVLGQGWVATSAGTGVAVVVSRTLASADYTHAEIEVVCAGEGTCNTVMFLDGNVIQSADNVGTGTYEDNGAWSGTVMMLNPSSGAAQGADVTMTRILLRGTGSNPFGDDNCV